METTDVSWHSCVSSTGKQYWHNASNGTSVWCADHPVEGRVAIIVPFRDLHSAQQRLQQLKKFVPYMTQFMINGPAPFKIYVVEQSNDGRKFNRGKLLNVGFALALQDNCSVFVFHDVDLLPSADLLPFYTARPRSEPVHIARRWDRYNKNPRYFGGIAVFNRQLYETINGYPNNYWGWGGEDDELRNRIEATAMRISPEPHVGSITDMEQKSLEEKLLELRDLPAIKCMHKKELLKEHADTWRRNGLSSFAEESAQYSVVRAECLSAYAVKVTVELALNGHWTDQQCVE